MFFDLQRYEKFPSFRLFSSLIYVSLNVKIYNFQSHNQIIKIPTTLLQLGSIFISHLPSPIFPLPSSLFHLPSYIIHLQQVPVPERPFLNVLIVRNENTYIQKKQKRFGCITIFSYICNQNQLQWSRKINFYNDLGLCPETSLSMKWWQYSRVVDSLLVIKELHLVPE